MVDRDRLFTTEGERTLYWERQQQAMRTITDFGAQQLFDTTPHIEQAFSVSQNHTHCIDTGTPQGGHHIAASGILLVQSPNVESALREFHTQFPNGTSNSLTSEEIYRIQGGDRFFVFENMGRPEKVVADARSEGITSHGKVCGGAKLWLMEHGVPHPTPREVEFTAAAFSTSLAEYAGIPYVGHIQPTRPPDLQPARVIYYYGTQHFDFSAVPSLPIGFEIGRRYLRPVYALYETQIAIQIAFGEKGFGNKFNRDNPLVLVAVGESDNPQFNGQRLESELNALHNKMPKDLAEKIRVSSAEAAIVRH